MNAVSSSPEINWWKYPIGGVADKENFEPNRKLGVALIAGGVVLAALGVALLATPGVNLLAVGVALLAMAVFLVCYGRYVYKTNRDNLLEETARPSETHTPNCDKDYREYLLESPKVFASSLYEAAQSHNQQNLVSLFQELRKKSDEEIEAIRNAFKEEVWDEGQHQDLTCRWVNYLLKNKKGAIHHRTSAEFAHFFAQIECR